jgi:hypothetical protein
MHEFVLRGGRTENPFKDAALVGERTSPSGKTIVTEGFHDSGDVRRLRFAANEEGEWRKLLRGEGVTLFQRGDARKPAAGRGFIGIHPTIYAFAIRWHAVLSDGRHLDSPITPALQRVSGHDAVSDSTSSHEYRTQSFTAASDPTYWACGTAQNPVSIASIRFSSNIRLVAARHAFARDRTPSCLAHTTGGHLPIPANGRRRERLRRVISRATAHSTTCLWTLSNEYETHPDGKYRLDVPSDVEWAKEIGAWSQLDPHRHPYTVHPVVSSSTRDEPAIRSTRRRIGGFYGNA